MRLVAVVETQNGTTQKKSKQNNTKAKRKKTPHIYEHNSDNIANKHFLFDFECQTIHTNVQNNSNLQFWILVREKKMTIQAMN